MDARTTPFSYAGRRAVAGSRRLLSAEIPIIRTWSEPTTATMTAQKAPEHTVNCAKDKCLARQERDTNTFLLAKGLEIRNYKKNLPNMFGQAQGVNLIFNLIKSELGETLSTPQCATQI